MVVIVDGSGSMREPFAGAPSRMTLAKDAIATVVNGLPDPVDVALIDFSNCDQVRLDRFYSQPERPSLIREVRGLQPDRGTPLARSIERAGNIVSGDVEFDDRRRQRRRGYVRSRSVRGGARREGEAAERHHQRHRCKRRWRALGRAVHRRRHRRKGADAEQYARYEEQDAAGDAPARFAQLQVTKKMRTGPVLASDLVDKYQPLGAFGQPVYMSYVQLRATITQKLGARHANYFAKPDRDPRNKSIHWISEVAGTARRWVDLSPEEQTRYALDLQALRSDFIRYLDELRRQGERPADSKPADGKRGDSKGAAAFASLLEEAMLVPDDSHLHFVGDQPVVSFWGFRNFSGQALDALTAGAAPAGTGGDGCSRAGGGRAAVRAAAPLVVAMAAVGAGTAAYSCCSCFSAFIPACPMNTGPCSLASRAVRNLAIRGRRSCRKAASSTARCATSDSGAR